MAFIGLIFVGVLFGFTLAAIIVGFVVVRSGGPLRESLFGDTGQLPAFATLGGRAAPRPATELTPELDRKLRQLNEELRITQRLVERSQLELQERAAALQAAAEAAAAQELRLQERDEQITGLTANLRTAQAEISGLREELSRRSEEVADLSSRLKDARTELEVSQSGADVVSDQIARLQQERDKLRAMVRALRQHGAVAAGKPVAPAT